MKSSTENEVAGKVQRTEGQDKGKDSPTDEQSRLGRPEGTGEKIAGKVQKKIGQVEKVIEKP